jgi:hypothetical protein
MKRFARAVKCVFMLARVKLLRSQRIELTARDIIPLSYLMNQNAQAAAHAHLCARM